MAEHEQNRITKRQVTPLVSIILPVYNAAPFLRGTLDSLFAQDMPDFELLAINDGSTDGSLAILRGCKDARLKIIDMAHNVGIPKAMNVGMRLARGRYLAVANADDVYMPQRFSKQIGYMQKNFGVYVCGGWFTFFGERRGAMMPEASKEIRANVLFICPICHPSAMFDGEFFRKHKILYDEYYRYALDYALWLRLVRDFPECGFGNVQEILVAYRMHSSNVSTSRFAQQSQFAMRAQYDFLSKLCGDVSAKERYLQGKLYFKALEFESQEELLAVKAWMMRLWSCNNESKMMDTEEFQRVLVRHANSIVEINHEQLPAVEKMFRVFTNAQ